MEEKEFNPDELMNILSKGMNACVKAGKLTQKEMKTKK